MSNVRCLFVGGPKDMQSIVRPDAPTEIRFVIETRSTLRILRFISRTRRHQRVVVYKRRAVVGPSTVNYLYQGDPK